jgi:hypothetical protein
MAKNNNRQQATAPAPKDAPKPSEPTSTEPTAPAIPEVGLGDLMGDGDNDPDMLATEQRLRELTQVNLDPQTAARMQEAMQDQVRGPGLDTTDRHSEAVAPPPAPPAIDKPVTAADLRDKRVTYPAKPAARCGETVMSLSRHEAGNRTKQSTVLVLCAEHHTACYCGKGSGIYTTYYCPVEGCPRSYKIVTPTVAQKLNERLRRNEQLPHPQQDITPR